jgi:hypothetical protein
MTFRTEQSVFNVFFSKIVRSSNAEKSPIASSYNADEKTLSGKRLLTSVIALIIFRGCMKQLAKIGLSGPSIISNGAKISVINIVAII